MIPWSDHIVSDPQILHGKPCFKHTRIPVALILGYLASGQNTRQIITEFPDLTEDHIAAALDFAREMAEFQVVET